MVSTTQDREWEPYKLKKDTRDSHKDLYKLRNKPSLSRIAFR